MKKIKFSVVIPYLYMIDICISLIVIFKSMAKFVILINPEGIAIFLGKELFLVLFVILTFSLFFAYVGILILVRDVLTKRIRKLYAFWLLTLSVKDLVIMFLVHSKIL